MRHLETCISIWRSIPLRLHQTASLSCRGPWRAAVLLQSCTSPAGLARAWLALPMCGQAWAQKQQITALIRPSVSLRAKNHFSVFFSLLLPHSHLIFHKKILTMWLFSSNVFSWGRNSFSALLKFFLARPQGRTAISKPGLLKWYTHNVLTSNGKETQLYLHLTAADINVHS